MCANEFCVKRMRKGPRRWKQNSGGDNFRPSSDANHRPKRSCSRRWIPGGALAAPAVAGTGGRPCRAAAARNAEAASWCCITIVVTGYCIGIHCGGMATG